MKGVTDLLNVLVAIEQHRFCIEDDKVANPVHGLAATYIFDYNTQVFGRDAQLVGIE